VWIEKSEIVERMCRALNESMRAIPRDKTGFVALCLRRRSRYESVHPKSPLQRKLQATARSLLSKKDINGAGMQEVEEVAAGTWSNHPKGLFLVERLRIALQPLLVP
jgi:hypothetical protein